ncbi:MAG: response regulator transcription factor [Acidobacteriota bacterium]
MAHLLVIDDDRMISQLLAEYLAPHGYRVTAVHDGVDGVNRALAGDVDVVLLDVMLPRLDGFEVLKRICARSTVPVIMLTARGTENDRIAGLNAGADDYVPKTFSHRELLARVNAVVRRSRGLPGDGMVEAFGISLDPAQRIARLEGARVDLTAVEFDILFALMRARGRVLSREQLVAEASQRGPDVSDRSIDVHVSSLRRKLGAEPRPGHIETVRSQGYRFRNPAEE